jgi:hypothetical protein
MSFKLFATVMEDEIQVSIPKIQGIRNKNNNLNSGYHCGEGLNFNVIMTPCIIWYNPTKLLPAYSI